MRAWLSRLQIAGVLLGALLLAAPFVAAFGLGLFWLYQHGLLLVWIGVAAAVAGGLWLVAFAARRRLRARARAQAREPVRPPEADWAPQEQAAWDEVMRLSGEADPEMVTDQQRLLQAGVETLRAVAAHYHPEQDDPLWEFTLPEALLLSERLSVRLRRLLLEEVPFSHSIRVGQVLRLWGYRPMVSSGLAYGRQAWQVYRLARLANPLHALASELRELFTQELSGAAREHLLRRIARIWVEEVGRAAIELYSGRLQRDADALAELARAEERTNAPTESLPGRARVVLAGRTQGGKSSLVNALAGEFRAGTDALPLTPVAQGHVLSLPDGAEILLVDTPGLGGPMDTAALIEAVADADMLLWVVPAHRADRAGDREALQAVRDWFAQRPQRRQPPLRVVASHIDRLSPARDWAPPYRIDPPEDRRKAQGIAAAREAVADDLGVPPEHVIPARLDAAAPYNVDRVAAELQASLPAMQQTRRARLLRQPQDTWRQALRQARRGGGRLLRQLRRRRGEAE